ncbi:MAG: metallophosphoesterase family protein [Kofleriaceae bacterium]
MLAVAVLAVAALAVGCDARDARPEATAATFTFAVLSDIHVPRSGEVPLVVERVIDAVIAERPRFVVITGDFTDGERWDPAWRLREVPGWWRAARRLVDRIRAAGIPVLPIAGNHDSYLIVHRQDYAATWRDLDALAAPLRVTAARQPPGAIALDAAPFCYSVEVDGVHLTLAHVVSQSLAPEVAAWIARDLEAARGARLRLVFGHVPLSSVATEPARGFLDRFGRILARGRADLYIAGHEHLAWDEVIALPDGSPLRQVLVGTASAFWRFGPTPAARARARCVEHADRARCSMPYDHRPFELRREHGRWFELEPRTFTLFTIDGDRVVERPFAVRADGGVAPFGLAASPSPAPSTP